MSIPWTEPTVYGIGSFIDFSNSVTLNLSGNTNDLDWNLGEIRPHLLILTPDASMNLTGIVAPEGDEPTSVMLFNPTAFDVQLIQEGTNSADANRFALGDNTNETLGPNHFYMATYFPTYGKWYITSQAG